MNFERPFDLEFLRVGNSGKPTVTATLGGKEVKCVIRVVDAEDYEVQFTPPLMLDKRPVEVRIGKKP